MRVVACILCAGVLLLCCACTAGNAPPQATGEVQPPQSAPAMTLAPGTDPLTGLPLEEGRSALTRPLAVPLDNVRVALPQRGVNNAAIVYEMIAESGITRLLAVYGDWASLPEVGPVRSARDGHVQLAVPLGALLLHVGGSTTATDMLEIYHYGDRSVNGYYETGALQLDADRNATVAIEHCWFTAGSLFSDAVAAYGLSTQMETPCPAFQFVSYEDEPRALTGGEATQAHIRFSSYDTTVLTYNAAHKLYYKSQFDAPQLDGNTEQALAFSNVVVLFADIGLYPDGVLANIDFSGGSGYYLCAGAYEPLLWTKGKPEQPLTLLRADDPGQLLELNPGTTYVAIVGTDKEKYFTLR